VQSAILGWFRGLLFTKALNYLVAGLEIISWLALVKLSGQIYFCLDKKQFWPDIHLFRERLPYKHVKAYVTMSKGIMGNGGLPLLD